MTAGLAAGWRQWAGRFRSRGSFAHSLATVLTGTTLAQGISVAAAPVLTRLYDPAALGVFGFYLAVVSVAGGLASGRFDQAVVLPRRDEEAASLLVLSLWLALGAGVVALLVMLGAGGPLLARTGMRDAPALRWAIPAGITASAVFVALSAWTQRRKDFRALARSRVEQAASTAGSQVLLGVLAVTGGLPGGHVLGSFLGSVPLAWRTWRADGPLLRAASSPRSLGAQAAAHADFPRYSAPVGALSALSSQLPSLVFPALFGSVVLGQYVLAYRVFSLPLSVVGGAFGQVFYQRAADQHAGGRPLRPLLVRSYAALLAVSIPPALLLMAFAPQLFAAVFGPEWRVAGHYTRLLLPWLAVGVATSPATGLFAVLGHQRVMFRQTSLLLVLRLAALLVGGLVLRSPAWAIGLFSAVGLVVNVAFAVQLLRLAAASDSAAAAG